MRGLLVGVFVHLSVESPTMAKDNHVGQPS